MHSGSLQGSEAQPEAKVTEQPQLEAPPRGQVHSCPPHTCDLEAMLSEPLKRADTQLHQW